MTRGSALFKAHSVAVRLRRRATESEDRDIGVCWMMDWIERPKMMFDNLLFGFIRGEIGTIQ